MQPQTPRWAILRSLIVAALLGAVMIPIAAGSQGRQSAQRYLIVALVSPSSEQVVQIVDPAGRVGRVVARHPNSNSVGAKWSPDGSMLAWVGPAGLTVERADGGHRRTLVPASTGCSQSCAPMTFAWSPKGKRLLVGGVGKETRRLQVVSVASGHRADLFRARAFTNYWAVDWSSDGHTIAYRRSSGEPGTASCCHAELFVAATNGTRARRLFSAADGGIHDSPIASLSPNGRFIAFSTDGRNPRDPTLAVIDLRSGKTHAIRGLYGPATWSPDSRKIAVPSAVVTLTSSGGKGKVHSLGTADGIAVWTRSGDVIFVVGGRAVLRSSGGRSRAKLLFRLPKNQGILSIDPSYTRPPGSPSRA